jgi:hypothetical protein
MTSFATIPPLGGRFSDRLLWSYEPHKVSDMRMFNMLKYRDRSLQRRSISIGFDVTVGVTLFITPTIVFPDNKDFTLMSCWINFILNIIGQRQSSAMMRYVTKHS